MFAIPISIGTPYAILGFQLVVAVILINSFVRFALDSRHSKTRLRVWAALTSAIVLLLSSVYYASDLSRSLAAVALSLGERQDESAFVTAIQSTIEACSSFCESWGAWWLSHPPATMLGDSAGFTSTQLPLVTIGLAYLVRGSIYYFLRAAYPRLEELSASYWAHITGVFLAMIFAHDVYGWGLVRLAILAFVLLVILLFRAIEAIGVTLRGLMTGTQSCLRLAVVGMKFAVLKAGNLARLLASLREELLIKWIERVVKPIERLHAAFRSWIIDLDARVEAKLKSAEIEIGGLNEEDEPPTGTSPQAGAIY